MIGKSNFMKELENKLIDKGLSPNSIKVYISQLVKLNNGNNLTDINFLLDTKNIMDKIKDLKDNTRKTYLAMLNSILSMYDKPRFKIAKEVYFKEMMELDKKHRDSEKTNEKSNTQKENWIKWDDVKKVKKELEDNVNKFINNRVINNQQYNILLNYLLLSLYTDIPPRRNDYKDMFVVKKWNPKMNTDKNYYSLADNRMIFNVYKTAKKYGQQIAEIEKSNPLINIIKKYLKHHPLQDKLKEGPIPFLVSSTGKQFIVNTITKKLNEIFGRKIGASMLRHIYLTNKYGDDLEEMKKDAMFMAHSTKEQKDYVKK